MGEALADGFLFLFGGVGYLAPSRCSPPGAVLVLRPMLPSVQPVQGGRRVPARGALMLGLAAGTLGLGPGDPPRDGFLDPDYFRTHGGAVGEALYWVVAHAVPGRRRAHPVRLPAARGRAAAHRRARSPASCSATHEGVTSTTRRVRQSTGEFAARARGRARRAPPQSGRRACAGRRARGAARGRAGGARHARRGAGARRPRALPGSLRRAGPAASRSPRSPSAEPSSRSQLPRRPPTRPAGSTRRSLEQPELTPMGNRRSAVTEADDFDYAVAAARAS